MDETLDHWNLLLTDEDKNWIKQILIAMTSNSLTYDTASLAVELAFKKGYAKGFVAASTPKKN